MLDAVSRHCKLGILGLVPAAAAKGGSSECSTHSAAACRKNPLAGRYTTSRSTQGCGIFDLRRVSRTLYKVQSKQAQDAEPAETAG